MFSIRRAQTRPEKKACRSSFFLNLQFYLQSQQVLFDLVFENYFFKTAQIRRSFCPLSDDFLETVESSDGSEEYDSAPVLELMANIETESTELVYFIIIF